MLLDHHVNSLLGIVEIELVILSLLLLLGLLLVIEISVHQFLCLFSLLHRNGWPTSIPCLRLGTPLLLRAAQDLFL